LASLKAVINLYREDKGLKCGDLGVVMKAKSVKSTHTYLTPDELSALENLTNLTPNQRDVRDMFLLQAWTGCRISDAKNLTLDNIIDGVLSYTSIKTHTYTSVPLKPLVESIIKRVDEIRTFPRATYNRIISELCWDADIINEVTLFKGGKQIKGEKWQFVSSHTARRSFATNLYNAGIETSSIAHMMGHGSISMTERYICCSFLDMNDKVKSFFK
jgi:integrase